MSLPGSTILLMSRYKIFSINVYDFKIRNDLSINCKDIKSVNIELLHEKGRNILLNVVYKPPNGKIEPFENFLITFSIKTKAVFQSKKTSCNSNSNFLLDLHDI